MLILCVPVTILEMVQYCTKVPMYKPHFDMQNDIAHKNESHIFCLAGAKESIVTNRVKISQTVPEIIEMYHFCTMLYST